MRIHIDFTLDVKPEDLPALKKLAETDSAIEAGWFIHAEAMDYVMDYMRDNGVPSTLVREK